MKFFVKVPDIISYLGIVISFVLLIILAGVPLPNLTIVYSAFGLLFLSLWFLAIKYILIVFGFFSSVLGK